MADPKIKTSIQHAGEVFLDTRPADVDRLRAAATQDELDHFKSRDLISGSWKSTKQVKEPPAESEVKTPPATTQPPATEPLVGGSGAPMQSTTALPAGFPGRLALIKAGLDTTEKVAAKSDEELEATEGIDKATVEKIRAALK